MTVTPQLRLLLWFPNICTLYKTLYDDDAVQLYLRNIQLFVAQISHAYILRLSPADVSVLNIPSLLVHLEILSHSLKHSFSQTDMTSFIFTFFHASFITIIILCYHLDLYICLQSILNNLLEDKDHA